ncbi:ABC transporter substrate-binding protein [Niabella drilacis]|uniref:Substrate-binding protein n=1 Tax=Niabella drilacis (strain DSM 25811 / CCM 8410 / CCUG 62505 / LMG 26954 / E90) TaxID=1285928 RepID=A0A1G6KQJ8_NIADE|nr:helical backbone metal receptor [Niabella drilacis]SDC33382.1 substrate-binding protein [Niabella drilacis]
MQLVSLVPSITELLYTLGLEQEVTGITKFCIHPQTWFRTKTRIGGTKTLDMAKITALQPDLIIANKEENIKEQVEALQDRFPVLVTDVNNYTEAISMIRTVGTATLRTANAAALISAIEKAFAALRIPAQKTAAYLIWKDPWMTVGGDTFISDMMQRAGFKNLYAPRRRYPVVNLPELQALAPEYLLLASEPYPFKEKHRVALQRLFPGAKILLADGTLFSWYGSRMLEAPAYFLALQKTEP